MILHGLAIKPGSLEETIAVRRFEDDRKIEYMKVQVMVSAIFRSAEAIASALSEGGKTPSMDAHNDLMDSLRSLMLPWIVSDKEDKTEKVKRIMEEEMKQGPLQVTSMEYNRKGNKPGLY